MPPGKSCPTQCVNSGELTNERSLGVNLDNLRDIAQLCTSHVGIHRPKENANHHKYKSWGAQATIIKAILLMN